jgi:hypothetical protein
VRNGIGAPDEDTVYTAVVVRLNVSREANSAVFGDLLKRKSKVRNGDCLL